jgi:hypothetical protein
VVIIDRGNAMIASTSIVELLQDPALIIIGSACIHPVSRIATTGLHIIVDQAMNLLRVVMTKKKMLMMMKMSMKMMRIGNGNRARDVMIEIRVWRLRFDAALDMAEQMLAAFAEEVVAELPSLRHHLPETLKKTQTVDKKENGLGFNG